MATKRKSKKVEPEYVRLMEKKSGAVVRVSPEYADKLLGRPKSQYVEAADGFEDSEPLEGESEQ